ncbi:MAG: prepilin peptidase [Lachnospiraceae bacterium]|nr:prepilin peptidase [Lachnospiraceae bacterium]
MIFILSTAVVFDLLYDKVPNALIAIGLITGFLYRVTQENERSILILLADLVIPFLIFFLFFLIHAFGAGDIKLLMVTGLYLGTASNFRCIGFAFVAAAMIGIAKLMIHKRLLSRFGALLGYGKSLMESIRLGNNIPPYITPERTDEAAKIHFSLPVLIGTLLVLSIG